MTTPPTCPCGNPATEQVDTGRVLTAKGWRHTWEWLCEGCSRLAEYERETTRRG